MPSIQAFERHRFGLDLTVALVGFTSWVAVCWKLGRTDTNPSALAFSAIEAWGAAVLCLWPLGLLGVTSGSSYAHAREWLYPMHLALQHWIGLRIQRQPLPASPWAHNLPPVFLASFCQPWLHLAIGAFLQGVRLRTFLWTQPLLLVPVFWGGRAHCIAQLAATPDAAGHLQRIASSMQRYTSWLPVGPMLAPTQMPVPAAGNPLGSIEGACVGVHLWLVVMLAYGLPAIVMHRLEGQGQHAWQLARKQRQREVPSGHDPGAGGASAAVQERKLLLQRRPNAIASAAELMLAGYAAWLLVQLARPLLA